MAFLPFFFSVIVPGWTLETCGFWVCGLSKEYCEEEESQRPMLFPLLQQRLQEYSYSLRWKANWHGVHRKSQKRIAQPLMPSASDGPMQSFNLPRGQILCLLSCTRTFFFFFLSHLSISFPLSHRVPSSAPDCTLTSKSATVRAVSLRQEYDLTNTFSNLDRE